MSTASITHEHEEDAPTPIRAEAAPCEHVYPPESEDDPLVRMTHHLPVHPAPPPSHPLTTTERSAFLGLQARQRELVQMFNEEERAILAEVEARLGLAPGSIGVSPTIDPQTWAVVAQPGGDGAATNAKE